MEAPPSSQFRADTAHIRTRFEDLTADEVALCNPYLGLLTQYNKLDLMPTETLRKRFWKFVFHRWDTNKPFIKPVLQKRTANATAIVAGTLKSDCPVPGQATKRKRNGAYVLPATRRQGAAVLLKLSINADAEDVNFNFTDTGNSIVPARLVQLTPGFTTPQVRSMLVEHWDSHESKRVSRHNVQLTVFWARTQLVAKLQREKAHGVAGEGPVNAASQDRPTGETLDETQDTSEMVTFESAYDLLEIHEKTVQETRRITHGFPRIRDSIMDYKP